MNYWGKILLVGLLATVGACAPTPPPLPAPAPPPPVVYVPYRPQPPGNAALTQMLPGRGIDGQFVTANSGLTGERAFWQLRIGLNVAAIGCRGLEEATLVSAYNDIVKKHANIIRSTENSVIKQLGRETDTNGKAARDRLSTQLFNYFAQPPAQAAFCKTANELAQVVATTPSTALVDNAAAQLAQIDQPFVDFYEAYAKYQTDVAAWDARYAPPPPVAAAPANSLTAADSDTSLATGSGG